MTISELQKLCAKIVRDIDKKYDTKRDLHLSFTQLIEEIGELARDINLPRLRRKKRDKKNLETEFADVILQVTILAEMLNIDLEKSVKDKIRILRKKHRIS
jgi:NTP pyrophosphatase (non-canonical NTP hydrolase)